MTATPFDRAMQLIDEANSQDPNLEDAGQGPRPRELLYSERMTAWLKRLYPDAGEALRLAVRAQHLKRWTIARADYPEGRAGYHKWRVDLMAFHATEATRLLTQAGYDTDFCAQVAGVVRKQQIRSNPEAQCLEDTACLTFLAHYFKDFAAKHPPEKVTDIVRKTWGKMSEHARSAALELPLDPPEAELVQQALAAPP